MKRIILTSGPQGAGKTTYVCNFLRENPDTELASRDEILMELFGDVYVNPYTNGHEQAYGFLLDRIEESLNQSGDNLNLIVDCWNGSSAERKSLIGKFRSLMADRVVCWKFTTPLEISFNWFVKREGKTEGEYQRRSYEHNYKLYNKLSENIIEDGFDKVYFIDSSQGDLFFQDAPARI